MRHSCNDGGACCVQDNGQPETPARFVVIDGAIVMCWLDHAVIRLEGQTAVKSLWQAIESSEDGRCTTFVHCFVFSMTRSIREGALQKGVTVSMKSACICRSLCKCSCSLLHEGVPIALCYWEHDVKPWWRQWLCVWPYKMLTATVSDTYYCHVLFQFCMCINLYQIQSRPLYYWCAHEQNGSSFVNARWTHDAIQAKQAILLLSTAAYCRSLSLLLRQKGWTIILKQQYRYHAIKQHVQVTLLRGKRHAFLVILI